MAGDWWKWCAGSAGGLAAGAVLTALWMDAQAWRAETERRLEGLEVAGAQPAAAAGEGARIIAEAKERMRAVAAAPLGAAAGGCEATGTPAGVARVTSPGGAGVSAEEWLAREEAS